jgi:hypothetical protein
MAPGKSPETGWGRLNVARLLGEDTEPNLFDIPALSGNVAASGSTFTALVGSGEPSAPSPSNPDPSHVSLVWVVVMENGVQLMRSQLNSLGGNDWTAQVQLPAWAGSSPRTLDLKFQSLDSTGHASLLVDAGQMLQAAGSVLPAFSHTPARSLPEGQDALISLSQSQPSPSFSGWTLHYRTRGGAWKTLAASSNAGGQISFLVPGAEVLEEALEYYFSAEDLGGLEFKVGDPASPYYSNVLGEHPALALKHYLNPAPSLCLRLQAPDSGSAQVEFFNVAGERVGGVSQSVQKGENLLCLDSVVSSGLYFARARMDSVKGSAQLKLVVRR